jgi:xylulose-5-phosphate/fructose-6-phosphate phosphoketolase
MTAWHFNKFINPVSDGVVLPILHFNSYKIANPIILARISHEELEQLLRGYGWSPIFVEGDDPMLMHEAMATALDKAIFKIKEIQHHSQNNDLFQRPRWPMIILNSPEGKGC